jgi:hypothetical protein
MVGADRELDLSTPEPISGSFLFEGKVHGVIFNRSLLPIRIMSCTLYRFSASKHLHARGGNVPYKENTKTRQKRRILQDFSRKMSRLAKHRMLIFRITY